jgi:hypothetical protein
LNLWPFELIKLDCHDDVVVALIERVVESTFTPCSDSFACDVNMYDSDFLSSRAIVWLIVISHRSSAIRIRW